MATTRDQYGQGTNTDSDALSLSINMLGRFFHLFVDAMLVSVVLSGIKRNTGLTLSLGRIRHTEIRRFLSAYLEAGEWVCIHGLAINNG